jgi:uncharacterized membrane protein YphA (DoxX/SURF4 family)
LLLLRAVSGTAIVVQGGFYLGEPGRTLATWVVGLTALLVGSLILVGFVTPVAGAAAGLGTVAAMLSLLPPSTKSVFDSTPSLIFGMTMLVTIVSVGPGAFSLDARMFGRREIIIPLPPSRSDR